MSTRKPFHFSQQQHLKCLLRTLPPQQLKTALYKLRNVVGSQLEASCKMISYKCYEFTIGYKGHKAFGYGRNETEAHINCIQNFLELLIEDEAVFPLIKEMLTNGGIATETNEITDKSPYSNPGPGKLTMTDETLALDALPERFEGDREFGNLTELNAFKGNMGNISAIEQDLSMSASKIDVRDLLGSLATNEKETRKSSGSYQPKLVQKEYETEKYTKYKRDSLLSVKGTSLVSTAYLSRGETISQDNDKKSREESSRKSLSGKIDENINHYRKENTYRSVKENLHEPLRQSGQKESYKQAYLVTNEPRSSREVQLNNLTGRESSKERLKNIQAAAASPKSRKLEPNGKCECHKHLLEAMNKWEKLEKEIAKLTEENKALKDRLIMKHSVQPTTKNTRTGSMTERHSEVPPIPNYMICQTHRRLTYQPTIVGASIDKENSNRTNTNTEESMRRKSYEKGNFEKDILRIKSLSKEYRKPLAEDSSLRRNVLHSYRERPKEGSLTERSSSISGLATRDPNRDMSSQWTGRAHYYKRKNW